MNLLAAIEAEPERHSPELTAEICIHKQKKKIFFFFLKGKLKTILLEKKKEKMFRIGIEKKINKRNE